MKQSDWQRAYEQAPASFTGRMETTLAHLKEEEPMKKLSLRIVCIAAAAVLALMGAVGWLNGLGWEYYWSLFVAAGLFGWQQKLIFNRDRDNCFKAFMNNNYVGLVLFLGLAMSYL